MIEVQNRRGLERSEGRAEVLSNSAVRATGHRCSML